MVIFKHIKHIPIGNNVSPLNWGSAPTYATDKIMLMNLEIIRPDEAMLNTWQKLVFLNS